MKQEIRGFFSVLAVLVLASACSDREQADRVAQGLAAGIVGGQGVSEEERAEMPGLASVVAIGRTDRSRPHCTGGFVSKRWVLTAGHCVFEKAEGADLAIAADVLQVSAEQDENGEPGNWKRIDQVIVHPGYRGHLSDGRARDLFEHSKNDLALIRLAEEEEFTGTPFRLAESRPEIGAEVRVYGFGDQSYDSSMTFLTPTSGELRFVDLKILAKEKIQSPMIETHDKFLLDHEARKGICFGDSGAPILDLQGDEPVILGVLSHRVIWTSGYACESRAAAAGAVADHREWILQNLGKDQKED